MNDSASNLRSYSSGLRGALGFVTESINLVHASSRDMPQQVARTIAHQKRIERLVTEHAGIGLEGLSMLDVGAGQRLIQMKYFTARGNNVVGVDRDLIVQGFDPFGYLQMARTNGWRRAIKTAGRKVLRFDARFGAEQKRQLGIDAAANGRMPVFQMDATNLDFPSKSFDFTYSLSVMQYVDDPLAVVREMARVLKPGGAAYVDFMPYTGPTGCLDVRMLGGRPALPNWAHLRAPTADLVRENAPLNQLRLRAWRSLFGEAMPGSVFLLHQPNRDDLEREIKHLQQGGELLEYDLDELTTTDVFVIWPKP